MADSKVHEVVMIGAGPASLSAAIYTTREDIGTVLYEKGVVGGLAAITDWVDNYPGFPVSTHPISRQHTLATRQHTFLSLQHTSFSLQHTSRYTSKPDVARPATIRDLYGSNWDLYGPNYWIYSVDNVDK